MVFTKLLSSGKLGGAVLRRAVPLPIRFFALNGQTFFSQVCHDDQTPAKRSYSSVLVKAFFSVFCLECCRFELKCECVEAHIL